MKIQELSFKVIIQNPQQYQVLTSLYQAKGGSWAMLEPREGFVPIALIFRKDGVSYISEDFRMKAFLELPEELVSFVDAEILLQNCEVVSEQGQSVEFDIDYKGHFIFPGGVKYYWWDWQNALIKSIRTSWIFGGWKFKALEGEDEYSVIPFGVCKYEEISLHAPDWVCPSVPIKIRFWVGESEV